MPATRKTRRWPAVSLSNGRRRNNLLFSYYFLLLQPVGQMGQEWDILTVFSEWFPSRKARRSACFSASLPRWKPARSKNVSHSPIHAPQGPPARLPARPRPPAHDERRASAHTFRCSSLVPTLALAGVLGHPADRLVQLAATTILDLAADLGSFAQRNAVLLGTLFVRAQLATDTPRASARASWPFVAIAGVSDARNNPEFLGLKSKISASPTRGSRPPGRASGVLSRT
jgi:hypothetical protein